MKPIHPDKIAQAQKLVAQGGWNKSGQANLIQVGENLLQLQPGGQTIYTGAYDCLAADTAFAKLAQCGTKWMLL